MAKRTKLSAILNAKCPQCREGDMFVHHVSKVSKFIEMHKKCPECNFRYEIEPGFFYGSMYIAYAFSVAIVITVGFATHILGNKPNVTYYIVNITIALLLFSPLAFRYARVLLLHLFGGIIYKEDAIQKFKNH